MARKRPDSSGKGKSDKNTGKQRPPNPAEYSKLSFEERLEVAMKMGSKEKREASLFNLVMDIPIVLKDPGVSYERKIEVISTLKKVEQVMGVETRHLATSELLTSESRIKAQAADLKISSNSAKVLRSIATLTKESIAHVYRGMHELNRIFDSLPIEFKDSFEILNAMKKKLTDFSSNRNSDIRTGSKILKEKIDSKLFFIFTERFDDLKGERGMSLELEFLHKSLTTYMGDKKLDRDLADQAMNLRGLVQEEIKRNQS